MDSQDAIPQVADLNLQDVVECVVVFKSGLERRYPMAVTDATLFQNSLVDRKEGEKPDFMIFSIDGPQQVAIDLSKILLVELGKKLRDSPEAYKRISE